MLRSVVVVTAAVASLGHVSALGASDDFFGHAADAPRKLVLEGLRFDANRGELLPESFPELDRAVSILKNKWGVTRVEVGGHTDGRGSDALNLALSQRRAESVRQYLVAQGLSPDRLIARGYGKSQPVADNESQAGRARNRRVELISID